MSWPSCCEVALVSLTRLGCGLDLVVAVCVSVCRCRPQGFTCVFVLALAFDSDAAWILDLASGLVLLFTLSLLWSTARHLLAPRPEIHGRLERAWGCTRKQNAQKNEITTPRFWPTTANHIHNHSLWLKWPLSGIWPKPSDLTVATPPPRQ